MSFHLKLPCCRYLPIYKFSYTKKIYIQYSILIHTRIYSTFNKTLNSLLRKRTPFDGNDLGMLTCDNCHKCQLSLEVEFGVQVRVCITIASDFRYFLKKWVMQMLKLRTWRLWSRRHRQTPRNLNWSRAVLARRPSERETHGKVIN